MSGECEKCGDHILDCNCTRCEIDKAANEKKINTESNNFLKVIKCDKCEHVLVSGHGIIAFSKGTSIKCIKCGNKHTF